MKLAKAPESNGTIFLSSSGTIKGIERTSKHIDGKIRANVVIIHGMGWSQRGSQTDEVAYDFIRYIEKSCGVSGALKHIERECPQYDEHGQLFTKSGLEGGLIIESDLNVFQSESSKTFVASTEIACMDRIEIDLKEKGSISVYRVFWDDPFYDAYEYRHLGYDDDIYRGQEHTNVGPEGELLHLGYEKIDALRARKNSALKMQLVTYGFSDAALYVGPVGALMREAIRGGMCAAIDEASGSTHCLTGSESASPMDTLDKDGKTICARTGPNPQFSHASATDLCNAPSSEYKPPLTIIAHSLGSRVAFDVLTRDRTDDLTQKLKSVSGDEIETFLFANQIPLIELGRLTPVSGQQSSTVQTLSLTLDKRLKFVAVSEINDILTYELVPYFEHLYYLRCRMRDGNPMPMRNDADCGVSGIDDRMDILETHREARQDYVRELGFDVVDVRAQFAPIYIPTLVANPISAHTGHIASPSVRAIVICGADNGIPRTKEDGCHIK